MRILVTGLGESIGGIGTLLLNIVKCNNMQNNSDKIQFEFLLPKNSEYKEVFKREGCRCYECPRLFHVIKYYTALKALFCEEQFDYVWINNTSKVDIILPLVAKKKGKARIVQHSHGVSCEEHGIKKIVFSWLEHIFTKKYESLIDIPFACSEASADYFYHSKTLRQNCTILGNGIFTERFRFNPANRIRIRHELNMEKDDILVGAVGRLTKVKNYPFLVKLIAALPSDYKGIIIGDGEDRLMLNELIQQYNIDDRFMLVGQKDNVEDYLSAMDIFAMPSFNEGMPFSIIEAQCSGLSCIASVGISAECDLTGNVAFLDIDRQDEWIKFCLNYISGKIDRNSSCKKIEEKGFNIEETYRLFARRIEVK